MKKISFPGLTRQEVKSVVVEGGDEGRHSEGSKWDEDLQVGESWAELLWSENERELGPHDDGPDSPQQVGQAGEVPAEGTEIGKNWKLRLKMF